MSGLEWVRDDCEFCHGEGVVWNPYLLEEELCEACLETHYQDRLTQTEASRDRWKRLALAYEAYDAAQLSGDEMGMRAAQEEIDAADADLESHAEREGA